MSPSSHDRAWTDRLTADRFSSTRVWHSGHWQTPHPATRSLREESQIKKRLMRDSHESLLKAEKLWGCFTSGRISKDHKYKTLTRARSQGSLKPQSRQERNNEERFTNCHFNHEIHQTHERLLFSSQTTLHPDLSPRDIEGYIETQHAKRLQ